MKVFKYDDGTLCYGCINLASSTDRGNEEFHKQHGGVGKFVECEITNDGKIAEVVQND